MRGTCVRGWRGERDNPSFPPAPSAPRRGLFPKRAQRKGPTGDGAHGARNNERQFVRAAESVRRLGLE